MLSIAACLFTAIALQNHSSLTEGEAGHCTTFTTAENALRAAVGPQTYSLRPRTSFDKTKSLLLSRIQNSLLSNPFSLTVLAFSVALAAASLLIPAQQLAPLDKVVALLQSIAMFYVAYPAAVCTGKVLLQTAPQSHDSMYSFGALAKLRNALEEIEGHSSVVYLPPAHIWQLTPSPPPISEAPSLKSSAFGRKSLPVLSHALSKDPQITIVTLNVQVKKDTTEEDILKMISWCREKCMTALIGNVGISVGKASQKQAELTVQVVRFQEDRALQAERSHHNSHADHEHGYGHACTQSHDHSHDEHQHSHGNAHSHAYEAVQQAQTIPPEQHIHSHDQSSHAHHHH